MIRSACLLLPLLLLAGCAAGPNYRAPKPMVVPAFGNGDQINLITNEVLAAWWRSFNDPKLNELVDHALTKLEAGTFGTCERCGEPISPARLEAMPAARYCINCASKR